MARSEMQSLGQLAAQGSTVALARAVAIAGEGMAHGSAVG